MGVRWVDQPGGEARSGSAVPARVREHARFDDAVRASAANIVDLYEHNPLLNAIVNDRDRFLAASLALDLHFHGPEGLTAAALKADCKAQNVCGPARISALVALMRWSGFLTAGPNGRLLPTARLIELHRTRWRRMLTAAGMVSPAAAEICLRLEEDRALAAFCGAQAEGFRAGFRLVSATPQLEPFIDQVAGVLILCDLALGAWPGRGGDAAALSATDLARRFSISRDEVEDVLELAQAHGLIERGAGTVTVRPALIAVLREFFGVGVAFNAACCEQALISLRATEPV